MHIVFTQQQQVKFAICILIIIAQHANVKFLQVVEEGTRQLQSVYEQVKRNRVPLEAENVYIKFLHLKLI